MLKIITKLLFGLFLLVFISGQNTILAQCPTSIAGSANNKKLSISGVSYTNITDIDISGAVTVNNKGFDGTNTTPNDANNTYDPCFDIGNECTLTFTHDGGTDVCVYDDAGNRANPLPIELLHFGAQQTNNKIVTTWQTATETNNDYFSLEKSTDLKTWQVIKTIQGAGNSNAPLEYLTTDDNPNLGVNYYQLKQTDYDGKFTYSKIVSVKFILKTLKDEAINVFPNPSNGHTINISLNNTDNIYEIRVINMVGTEVYSASNLKGAVPLGLSQKQITFKSKLPAGIYSVLISSDNEINSQKFIVK